MFRSVVNAQNVRTLPDDAGRRDCKTNHDYDNKTYYDAHQTYVTSLFAMIRGLLEILCNIDHHHDQTHIHVINILMECDTVLRQHLYDLIVHECE